MSLSNYSLNQRLNYILTLLNGLTPPIGGFVTINGNQTIGTGVKTFTNLPACSAVPTTNAQLVNKLFVDNAVAGVPTPTLQAVVNTGSGISNFVVGSTASITSTNFTNNRQLLLNANADPTIKMIDNLNASHYTTFDIDTLNLNGTSTNWSTIVAGSATPTLSQVLTAGNDAGNNDIINLNLIATANITDNGGGILIDVLSSSDLNIGTLGFTENINVIANDSISLQANNNDIFLNTPSGDVIINGSAYPPVVPVDTLSAVLTAGDTALSGQVINLLDTNFPLTTFSSGGMVVDFDDGVTASNTSFGTFGGTDGIQHSGNALFLTTNGTLGFSSDNITANSATFALISDIPTSVANPTLQILNTFTGAGTTNGVPSVQYYKSGRNGANNDVICSQSFNAKNSSGVKTEFAKIETTIRNVGVGNDDGSISIFATLNGVSTEFARFNGADGDNNFLRPLDMNGSAITSSSGNMSLSASASSGTGTITLTPKPLGNLIFQNLPTAVAGLPSGAVWNNLGVLNIAP